MTWLVYFLPLVAVLMLVVPVVQTLMWERRTRKRIDRLRAREDSEVAYLDALYSLPAQSHD